jgi:hypothetical protein
MSWDIVLFSSKQKIKTLQDLAEDKLVLTNFCTAIENHFPLIIKDDKHREIKGDDYSIEYLHSDEHSTNMLLNLYGENGIYAMIDFAKSHNYQIYDTGLDDMLDLANPGNNGYKDFQKYLAQILNR